MLCAGKLFPWNRYDSFLTSLAYVSWMKVISGTNTSAVKTLTSVKSAESGPQKNRSHTAVAVGKYGLQLCSWQFFQRIRFPPLFLGAIWSCPPKKKNIIVPDRSYWSLPRNFKYPLDFLLYFRICSLCGPTLGDGIFARPQDDAMPKSLSRMIENLDNLFVCLYIYRERENHV